MARPSSIEILPADILEQLQALLRDPRVSQLACVAEINAILSERGEQPVSRSALNRYAKKMEKVGERMLQSRQVADMWIAKLGNAPQGKTGQLINEVAPRPHNSGHFTLGACATSQFEQHLRAICGLPLGDPTLLRPVVMVNLLGDLWRNGPPPWDRLLAHPQVRLHLYGKDHARPGRKMGHFLFLDEDGDRALCQAKSLLQGLTHESHQEKDLATESDARTPPSQMGVRA